MSWLSWAPCSALRRAPGIRWSGTSRSEQVYVPYVDEAAAKGHPPRSRAVGMQVSDERGPRRPRRWLSLMGGLAMPGVPVTKETVSGDHMRRPPGRIARWHLLHADVCERHVARCLCISTCIIDATLSIRSGSGSSASSRNRWRVNGKAAAAFRAVPAPGPRP